MPELGLKAKCAIGGILFILVMGLGVILFPTPQPEVHLAPNYGVGEHPVDPFLEIGPILISNTIITAWISMVVLAIFFFLATRKMKLIPSGLQNIAEMIIEMLLDFMEGVAGKENARRFFGI